MRGLRKMVLGILVAMENDIGEIFGSAQTRILGCVMNAYWVTRYEYPPVPRCSAHHSYLADPGVAGM